MAQSGAATGKASRVGLSNTFFDAISHHASTLAPNVQTPPYRRQTGHVTNTYCILVIGRSGSTWLGQQIASYGLLGHPDEYFNQQTFGESLRHNPSLSVYEYYDCISLKVTAASGTFGFRISPSDLRELEKEATLESLIVGQRTYFLSIRKDIAAQALSMRWADFSQVHHQFNENKPRKVPPYDPSKLRENCRHIVAETEMALHWLSANRRRATLLVYEDLMTMSEEERISRFASHVGTVVHLGRKLHLPMPVAFKDEARDEQLQRFKHDNVDYLAELRAEIDVFLGSPELERF